MNTEGSVVNMHGPGGGPGGPHGGMPMGGGAMPPPRRRYGLSWLGTGLTAALGAAVGAKLASGKTQNTNNKYNELFNYCPVCGAARNGNGTTCSSCGASLIR